MSTGTLNGHIDLEDVKASARGRWPEILTAFGFDGQSLDGRHHPCPRCGGTDRFLMVDQDAGAVLCNQCFAENNGDGLAAIAWRNDWTFGATIKAVAEHLGIAGGERKPGDIVADGLGRNECRLIRSGHSEHTATSVATSKWLAF